MSEAIVAIPFTDQPIVAPGYASTTQMFGKNFFSISRNQFDFQKTRKQQNLPVVPDAINSQGTTRNILNTSVSELYEKMTQFVFPPELDFNIYDDLQPFVMYVFPFKSILTKQDLANIYQGLMPKIATTTEKEESVISHTFEEWEFFEGKKLPNSGIRWLVFKVKEKCATNYWDVTADSRDDDRFKFQFANSVSRPDYSFNYPADFFSLVELGKIDTSVIFEPKGANVGQNAQSTNQLVSAPIRKTNIIGKVQ